MAEDAVRRALAGGYDALIVDTAGRLQVLPQSPLPQLPFHCLTPAATQQKHVTRE